MLIIESRLDLFVLLLFKVCDNVSLIACTWDGWIPLSAPPQCPAAQMSGRDNCSP